LLSYFAHRLSGWPHDTGSSTAAAGDFSLLRFFLVAFFFIAILTWRARVDMPVVVACWRFNSNAVMFALYLTFFSQILLLQFYSKRFRAAALD
jgi:hypothetical protein